MARPNFFNENKGRTFPFLQDFQENREVSESSLSAVAIYDIQLLPNDAIVDFGCNLGVLIDYDPAVHVIYLAEVRRQESNIVFDFRCTAPDLADKALLFSRAVTSADYETEFNDAVDVGLEFSLSISECGDDTDWNGYLSTGSMETLAEILENDGDKLKGDSLGAIIEHGLVRSLQDTFMRSINLANADRTRAENPSGCIGKSWPFTIQPIYINRECITGHIRFVEGYNTVIDQDALDGSLTLNAAVGGGAGEPCEEVPLFGSEAAPEGDTLLTGGPTCSEVIRSINGVGGRVVDLLSGPGVTITSDPDNNRVIADFNMRNLALCYEEDDFDESSCPEESTSNAICGPE